MAGPLTIPITGGSVAAGAGGSMLSSVGGLGGLGSFLSGVGAVGSLFGGGSDGIDVSENYRLARAMQDVEMMGHQKRYANIVAGAKKAGLHPLFALGAVPQSGSPAVIGGQSSRGGRAADALAQTGQAMMAFEAHKQSLKESNARIVKDQAQAELAQAEALSALRRNQANPQNDQPPYTHLPFTNPWTGEVEWLPNTQAGFEMGEALGLVAYGEGKGRSGLQDAKFYKHSGDHYR